MSVGFHTPAIQMSHLPSPLPVQAKFSRPWRVSSHRQWQNLLVEFTDGLRMANRNGKEVGRKLADAGAAFRGHFTQAGIHGCGSTNFDLLALTFVRLGHADDLGAEKVPYLVPTRQTSRTGLRALRVHQSSSASMSSYSSVLRTWRTACARA